MTKKVPELPKFNFEYDEIVHIYEREDRKYEVEYLRNGENYLRTLRTDSGKSQYWWYEREVNPNSNPLWREDELKRITEKIDEPTKELAKQLKRSKSAIQTMRNRIKRGRTSKRVEKIVNLLQKELAKQEENVEDLENESEKERKRLLEERDKILKKLEDEENEKFDTSDFEAEELAATGSVIAAEEIYNRSKVRGVFPSKGGTYQEFVQSIAGRGDQAQNLASQNAQDNGLTRALYRIHNSGLNARHQRRLSRMF